MFNNDLFRSCLRARGIVLAVAGVSLLTCGIASADNGSVSTQKIIISPKVETAPGLPGSSLQPLPGTAAQPAPVTAPQLAPEVHYGEEGLPEPVRKTRSALITAARAGDLHALAAMMKGFSPVPQLSTQEQGEPYDLLKGESGDPDGREIMAILWSVLDAGWVVEAKGTPQEAYIWPYFSRTPLDKLSGPQLVEMFRLVTAGDFQQMKDEGAYTFFHAEISADGQLKDFLTDF